MKGMVRASASAAREQRVGHKNATGLCAIDVLLLTLNCAKNEVDWMEAMDSIFLNQESGFVAVIFCRLPRRRGTFTASSEEGGRGPGERARATRRRASRLYPGRRPRDAPERLALSRGAVVTLSSRGES